MSDRRPIPPFRQARKRLEIQTVLNDGDPNIDALLLIWVKGSEEISQPYTYNVKMWRLVGTTRISTITTTRPPIPPADMINTQVGININFKQTIKDDPILDNEQRPEINAHVRRCGVFETFNDEGLVLGTTAKVEGEEFQIRQYSATIVPAFKMMSYETAYRVFENKTVVEIIDEVTAGFPNFRLNKDRLSQTLFPTMQYCVQYNESTFNFLSRLMARFGIWYFFDHNRDANANVSTMMLGAGPSNFDPCKENGGPLDPAHPIHRLTEINNRELPPGALTIKDFQRIYAPMTRRARFGNFNILNPVDPITNVADIDVRGNDRIGRDLIRPGRSILRTKDTGNRDPDDDDRFRTENFVAPVDLKTAPKPGTKGDAPDAQTHASQWMRNREALVARVSGSSRNAALMPGFLFERMSPAKAPQRTGEDVIGEDDKAAAAAGADVLVFTNPSKPKPNIQKLGTYVLIRVEFEGVETAYSHQREDLAQILKDLLFPKNLTTDDVLANSTVQALNSYLQKAVPQNIKDGTLPDLDLETLLPGGSALGMLGAAVPLILKVIEKLKGVGASNDFHCSFAAIPVDTIDYQGDGRPTVVAPLQALPSPAGWFKPIVNGPHLAVVIGKDGTKTEPDEIFADSLGRVRVRFPWDHKKGEKPGDGFKRGDNACWVRVSEGWAGRQFGTQFLPRIGQEVIIDFLDGDPDRPILTGRVYNADHGFANLPFTKFENDLEMVEQKDLLLPVGGREFRFTGIKTNSTPASNGEPRYHLTRYDDTLNCEQYLIRSQGRLDVTAFAHSFETTKGNRHVKVVEGHDKDKKPFGGSAFTTIGGEYDLHVGGSHYTAIDKDNELTVKGDTQLDLKGKLSVVVGQAMSVGALSIVLEATTQITLKVGGSWIVVSPCGVFINGPTVLINSGGAPQPSVPVTMLDVADAQAAEPGDKPAKRETDCDPHPKGGGKRGSHTSQIQPAPPCEATPDGKISVNPPPPTPDQMSKMQQQLDDLKEDVDILNKKGQGGADLEAVRAQRDLIRRRDALMKQREDRQRSQGAGGSGSGSGSAP